MKQCKQLFDQSITKLISYINLLKKQFSVFFTKYMQYGNLLKTLYSYFKNAIIHQIIFIIIQNEFKKLTRFFEKNKSMSNKLKNWIDICKNKKNNRKNEKYNSYFKNSKSKKFQKIVKKSSSQNAIIENRNQSQKRNRKNFRNWKRNKNEYFENNCDDKINQNENNSSIMCWNCNKSKHIKFECKTSMKIFEQKQSKKNQKIIT